jgi:putative glutamine amidotransferase
VKPLIGIAGEALVVTKHFGEQHVVASPRLVIDGVRAAGGLPVVLPPGAGADELAALGGLVLAGGVDLGVDPARDRDEVALAHAAREQGLPTLGLCRGLQLLAVATGGTLEPDLGDSHLIVPPGTHPLHTVPGSVVAPLVPDGRVGSLHHQSVATYDDRWRRTATAPDGVVEALEWADQAAWPALGVQWHPELDATGPAVFGWLVRVAGGPLRTANPVSCLSGAMLGPWPSRTSWVESWSRAAPTR